MNELFVPYQQSLDMKELGFDEPCFGIHFKEGLNPFLMFATQYGEEGASGNGGILAPTFSQAFKFFREKYGLYSHVRESYSFDKTLEFVSQINGSYVNHGIYDKPVNRFETYEEAELECLIKLIELAKNK